MFTRRGHGDVKKSTQKVLDPKKDVVTRLKHLRSLLDIIDKSELKPFFENNCSQIYFILHENFITLESNLKQKGIKSQREELDSVLFIFEKILQLLPEKIYNRWQFHSIGSILKKLLHTGNSFKIRCEGIRLFLLWLQALRDNCAEEQFLIFACLVPGFPAVPSSRGPCTLDTIIYNPFSNPPDAKVVPEEITPLVPAVVGEKVADDQTCYILETLLKFMVVQASSLEWKNKENQETGFRFLFSLFKKYYLPHLFPSFTKLTNLYKPLLDLPHHRPKPLYVPVTRNNESTFCTRDQYLAPRVAFITWLVTFFLKKKYVSSAVAAQSTKNGTEVLPKLIQTVTAGSSSQEKEKEKILDSDTNGPAGEPEKSHSNSSTLSDRRASDSSLCSIEEEHRYVYDMVHAILLSTRDNVNFVNEVFHQAFLLPSCEASATRKVIKVYRTWILQEKPSFMTEPDKIIQEDEVDDGTEQIISAENNNMQAQILESHGHKRSSSWGRTYSFSSAISRGFLTEEQNRDIKAGIQPTLQVFLTNSSNVFLLEPCQDVPKLLENQVEVCKCVLSIYRHMIMEHTMNSQTWEQMLQVLLRITEAVMKRPSENQRKDSFAESLASILFRTIIVAWVRANLCVYISRELWDELLTVLSSLTYWEELVTEWASIMDSLTAVLARSVYGLDMANLPLDKLSEQKEKKQRARGVIPDSQKAAAVARSFSLSWRNQGDVSGPGVQEPMRIRSATTSGAPGVEKARNIVRQKASAKRSQSISNCVHLCEAMPTTKSVPMLLHTVSSFLPGVSSGNSACSHRLSDVEECQLSECGEELGGGDGPLPRSSSTSDITQQLSDTLQAQKRENSPTSCGSDSRTSEDRRENSEPPMILIRRSSSPPDTEDNSYGYQQYTRAKLREKSESISSETSNGYLNEAEVTWQAFEEEADSQSTQSTHMDVIADPQSQGSLLLSHHEALADSSECLADDVSIIAGGTLTGWHADSAFVLWRRILGILGDVNNIQCPKIHAKVFSYLYELWQKLAKIRDNLGISVDNQTSPPQPAFIPPLRMLASWLFRATMLPAEYKAGKLQAYKLICEMMTRHQDVLPNSDFLVHLYHILHKGFTSDDQDALNTIIRSCSPRFFFLGLPGFTMLVGDFITAAARVLSCDSSEAPRMEAQTILGSLVCFPNLYVHIPVLRSVAGSDDIVIGNEDIKDYLVNILLEAATKEHCERARCIAVCSLGLWVCEELMQEKIHDQVKDAINVLGVTLKFGNKAVAQVASDVFQLLISHWEPLQSLDPTLPKKIIEIFVATIAFLLPSAEHSTVEADKKLMVSLLLCLLDWCMAVPLNLLLEPITMSVLEDNTSHRAPLLDYIYRMLHCCVSGSTLHTQQSHYLLSLADLSTDYDLMLGQVKSFEPPPSQPTTTDFGSLLTVAEEKRRRSMELIPLTARMVMTHLVNHLGHHPLSGGPALLHSLVSENHDNPYVESSELSSEVFKSPNLQLFVFNDTTLVSYLQIPTETPSVGNPPHLSSQVRVIVRDISGKYSWDGSVLFSTSQEDSEHIEVFNSVDHTLLTTTNATHSSCCSPTRGPSKYHSSGSDALSDLCDVEEVDVLDKLLEELGQTSPECLPQSQLKLNQPAPSPSGMNLEQESAILSAILRQTQQEEEQVRRWDADVSFRAACQREPSHQEPKAPFYFCRLLLNDLGMNSWDRRKSFHLLKKNSKLLRELKNLDSRQCRETHKIAVFYIGEGQEDKCSILSNSAGSKAYEDFVSGLGWEVDLATHCGFMGGLQRNGSTGLTAPYYATSTVEAIFHVSTRMPSDSDDSLTKKLRHLGNDEVHIVWSEHTRDYRRGIIPTDFGDVLIVIYPMKNHMYFIQIMKKPQVPFFGPLFNGAIINGKLLPSLVRATCINASRAVKSRLTLYQSFYEERALYLEAIVQNHREVMTFEDFASQVFSPSPGYPTSGTACRRWPGMVWDMEYPWAKLDFIDLHTPPSPHLGTSKQHQSFLHELKFLNGPNSVYDEGSLSSSTNTEVSASSSSTTAAASTDPVDQVSPTMPRAAKNRVSGKLRRSASAISKSSN
ncbi:ral GTPase-activating protein subunit alpha-2 isoform X6 [Dunckerocampus dactyliophorus]|uniref:ral GTPase-activating protein subunit alpha-2 isoform X6 n=1 Tax=Dunckerocampus dactyliophorus TaxID=161453 RepID=UPI0024062507|nr:ral GTPase-activating protein subunit alpha-2 isoform X6 [Dunckerocampus dactyliophorus]